MQIYKYIVLHFMLQCSGYNNQFILEILLRIPYSKSMDCNNIKIRYYKYFIFYIIIMQY